MRFLLIRGFSEAVDPEQRKARLQKLAKYSRRHDYLSNRMWARKPSVGGKASSSPEAQTKLRTLFQYHKKWVAPHERRASVSRALVKKFKLPKGSVGRQEISAKLRGRPGRSI